MLCYRNNLELVNAVLNYSMSGTAAISPLVECVVGDKNATPKNGYTFFFGFKHSAYVKNKQIPPCTDYRPWN